jgi:hypothetical protein
MSLEIPSIDPLILIGIDEPKKLSPREKAEVHHLIGMRITEEDYTHDNLLDSRGDTRPQLLAQ